MALTLKEHFDAVIEILESREKNYNDPNDNFQDIADAWTAELHAEGLVPRDKKLSTLTVARLNVMTKMIRDAFRLKMDNWDDTAGYTGCAWRIIDRMVIPEEQG